MNVWLDPDPSRLPRRFFLDCNCQLHVVTNATNIPKSSPKSQVFAVAAALEPL
jgi:hypothetical protein